ncbi:hypothetical protein [Streptomyces sp. TRM68367]|uniref:hypothetical protein n=1 Tax=Streptomyces sp. TRM68367 TaxID=2758415 RepID=UPI00165C13F8|nr:hypothetical protein [Streptomyces sp. TRM68367]MBC9727236.1 hypothetical protein [Streptomyces sp. TRM68367]
MHRYPIALAELADEAARLRHASARPIEGGRAEAPVARSTRPISPTGTGEKDR